ncbi:MAG: DUF547 domain-containing protein [Proteobacteria bacterium]|nr:DUF547 domain-containing protein [Pseudomonadota bacterium]
MKLRGRRIGLLSLAAIAATIWLAAPSGFRSFEALAAPGADPWQRWKVADEDNPTEIDFSTWDGLLRRYLIASTGGVNLFRYGAVTAADRAELDRLVAKLAALPISAYNRAQQRAYWINLYNALTVKVVLDNGPVGSIRDIDISPGFFSDGPWGKKLLQIEGEAISLNDMEHRILRPLWADPRIHYALNCASMGCPNLGTKAYVAQDMEARLDAAARAFINHPRGVHFEDGELVVSSIYDWFTEDFGGGEAGVLAHLRQYAAPALAEKLARHGRLDRFAYDWRLNGTE